MSLKAIDEFLLLSRLYQTNEATFATYTVLSYAPSTLSRRCKTPMNFSFQVKRAVMFNISEHRRWINWCDKIVHLSRYLYYKYKHFQDRRRKFFTNKSEFRQINWLFFKILQDINQSYWYFNRSFLTYFCSILLRTYFASKHISNLSDFQEFLKSFELQHLHVLLNTLQTILNASIWNFITSDIHFQRVSSKFSRLNFFS